MSDANRADYWRGEGRRSPQARDRDEGSLLEKGDVTAGGGLRRPCRTCGGRETRWRIMKSRPSEPGRRRYRQLEGRGIALLIDFARFRGGFIRAATTPAFAAVAEPRRAGLRARAWRCWVCHTRASEMGGG